MANVFEAGKSAAEMRRANPENFNVIMNGRSMRPPLRTLYIFSVAKRSFQVRHMLFPKLTLRGCEDGERYVRCTSVADPIPQACPDEGRGGTRTDDNDGWVACIDMLAPGNFTMDPYSGSTNPSFFENRSGTNLIAEGLFPSENEIPTEEELKRAEKARDSRYKFLTREAQRLAAVSTKDLNEFLQSYPDTHIAMDSLGLEANWHSKNEVKVSCQNCGDSIRQGIAFHQSSSGILCIIDPDRALKAGAINRDRYNELTGVDTEPSEVRRGVGRPRKEEVL
jgi:hypothetical protein